MDKHELAVMRGEEAERLLNSDMLQQAFTDTRTALQKTWAELPTGYFSAELKAQHHDLHRMMKLLGMVEACLRKHIETGKVSHKHIETVAKQSLLRRVG
jgi:hypothetical protein